MNTQTEYNTQTSGAMGFFLAGLTLMFIAFKLLDITAVAQLSWIWVLSPLWIQAVVGLLLAGILAVMQSKHDNRASSQSGSLLKVFSGLMFIVVVLAVLMVVL